MAGSVLAERYRIDALIGSGGMGVVYRVTDLRTERVLALKTVVNAEADAVSRLKREWRALANIRHPNIVELHDLFAEDGRVFFTMDLVVGVDFVSYVRAPSARLQPEAATRRLRSALGQVVLAVTALHDLGKLHRDIKPSNVLVREDGRVALLDFGLVEDASREGPQTWAGTPGYMSPEQAAHGQLGPSSDFYSIGVMLYEALTGRLPGDHGRGTDTPRRAEDGRSEAAVAVPGWLDELCLRLLREDPGARPGPRELLALLDVELTAPLPSGAGSAPFVGREQQLAKLHQAFERAPDGASIVFLRGPSGVGKSALAQKFVELLRRRGVSVFTGRCYERDSVPYKALDGFIEALARDLQQLDPQELDALLPRQFESLCRTFPAFLRVVGVRALHPRGATNEDPHGTRHRAGLALRELLGRMTDRRRTVVWLDDVQWGDADSAGLLQMLLDPPDAPRLLLVLSYRSEGEASSPFVQLSRSAWLERIEHHDTIDVGPFTDAESRDLLAVLAPLLPPDESANIVREAHGLPFFAGELVRAHGALARSGTHASLEQVLLERVGKLGTIDQRTIEAVSLAGRPVPRAVVLQGAGIGPAGEGAFARLEAASLLTSHGSNPDDFVEPFHDRVREIVANSLPPETARRLHLGLARALEQTADCDPEHLAFHLAGAGDPRRAAAAMEQAASRAAHALAFEHAASLYRRALELVRDVSGEAPADLVERSADACVAGGLYDLAAQLYEERLRLGCEGMVRADLLRRSAEVELLSGRTLVGARKLEQMLATLGFRVPGTRFAVIAGIVRFVLRIAARAVGLGRRQAPSRSTIEQGAEDAVITRIGGRLAEAFYWSDYTRAVFYQLLAATLAEGLPASADLSVTLSQQGFLFASYGFRTRAMRLLDRARAAAEEVGSTYARSWEAILRGFSLGCGGDADGQVKECVRAEEILRDSVDTLRLREAWIIKSEALLALGETGMAEALAHRLRRLAEQLNDPRGVGWSLLVLGMARARLGDWPAAAETLAQAVRASERGGDANYRLNSSARLSFVLCVLGRTDEALQIGFETAKEYERRWLRHNTCCADGIFLAAAGVARLRGAAFSRAMIRAANRTLRRRRRFAGTLKFTEPLFLAGAGAWLIGRGDRARGRRSIESAIATARQLGLSGELHDVHVIAALAAEEDAPFREHHESEAARLEGIRLR